MQLMRVGLATVVALAVTACGRQATTADQQSAPAVSPAPTPADTEKHYTLADYQTACFPYPTPEQIEQFKQIANVSTQGAIDYQYKQWAQRYPGPTGFCEQKRANSAQAQTTQPNSSKGTWVENAPNNDMSHYGDALPHGNN